MKDTSLDMFAGTNIVKPFTKLKNDQIIGADDASTGGQSYKNFTLVIYDSRGVL